MSFQRTPSFEVATFERGSKDAPKIALVLPGRLDTKDYPHMRSHVEYLAQRGYLALSFDPPGTWESPGDIAQYTMTNYLKVINELIGALGNKPALLIGHSRGGSMAMLAGVTNPYVTHFGAFMSSTTASIPSFEGSKSEVSYRDDPFNPEQKRKFELPLSYFEDARRFDINDGLASSKKAKLFIAGLRDDLIEPEEVRENFARASEPKKLVELDSDHDYRLDPGLISEVNKVLGEFLDEYGG